VKWVELPFPQVEPALVQKHSDAFVAAEPLVTRPVDGLAEGGVSPRALYKK
jgi:hypothetical protein